MVKCISCIKDGTVPITLNFKTVYVCQFHAQIVNKEMKRLRTKQEE